MLDPRICIRISTYLTASLKTGTPLHCRSVARETPSISRRQQEHGSIRGIDLFLLSERTIAHPDAIHSLKPHPRMPPRSEAQAVEGVGVGVAGAQQVALEGVGEGVAGVVVGEVAGREGA